MKHALVVGGTGMLADVSLFLANDYRVSVIGRNKARMDELIKRADRPAAITPALVNYRDEDLFKAQIKKLIEMNGPFDMVVAWIHSGAGHAIPIIAEENNLFEQPWKLFHILGSSTNLQEVINGVKVPDSCLYRQIQLGFIIEHNRSRWLTHQEISAGVIKAITQDQPLHIIGTVEPWDMRP
ncbi:short-chain dehydrogenase [Bacillus sp. FJAT-49732]|uniref:Short-chain dehydrogenase n=1 Tax=Lederbergia citrisecunda TaxID=2833583 RepID=A0A942TTV4_9BACI|nr:short-chain dehydrogenase [Lederbergia citrisecunda]MBS4201659.1 short-chain dehydrogenase [Lederbergia citrisecunda]